MDTHGCHTEPRTRLKNKTSKGSAAIPPPDHSPAKKRVNRVRGQVEAVSRMIDERRYCLDIIQQIRAATSALNGLEQEILKGHLKGCVRDALEAKDPFVVRDKIDEILKIWS